MIKEQLSGFSHSSQAGRARLLLVDDQPVNIQALYQIFKDRHEVFMATSGQQAIDLALDKKPNLILLDIVMPEMDGLQVCRQLKANPNTRDIPIIFVTSQEEPHEEARGLAVGAVDFISKPINPAVVEARVNTQLLLKEQSDLLRKMAYIDVLTGIANRRNFNEQIQLEWRAAKRAGTPLAMILLDIDHFKLYNDHYGHQEGDNCLAAVARALQGRVARPRDLLARYGGEEFACLLPDTDLQGTSSKAEEFMQAVRNLQLPHAASPTAPIISISLGVAAAVPKGKTSTWDLVKTADSRLYLAKQAGRNQLCNRSE